MKVKLDNYEIDILINGLFQQRCDYDAQTNSDIDDLLFQIVQKVNHKKPCCRQNGSPFVGRNQEVKKSHK